MLPRLVIWPVGNSDIYSDASGLSLLAHSDHIPPELPALFPPAERAVANLFMQGWQWRQPDLLRDKTAKGFWAGSPSVARWMLLEVLCRAGCAGRAAQWGWLAAPEREPGISSGVCCWGASRASCWGSCQAELCSQFIPAAACEGLLPAGRSAELRKEGTQRAWGSAAWHFRYILPCLQLLNHNFREVQGTHPALTATSSVDTRCWAIQFTFCMACSSCTTFPYAMHLIEHFDVLVSRTETPNSTVKEGRANGYLWLWTKPNCSRPLGSPGVTSQQRTWNIISTLANYPVPLPNQPNHIPTFPSKVIPTEKSLYSVLQGYKKGTATLQDISGWQNHWYPVVRT